MFNYLNKDQWIFHHKVINPEQDNRSCSYGFLIKRGADIFFSALVLLVLTLPILVIMMLIKFDSPGSIFFTQQRIGLGKKQFKLFKFRTMVENASSLQSCLEKENEIEGGVLFKIKEDPRITRVGKFLRRYSIDELPQLVNVLKGDMSIVGPRPLTIRDFSRLSPNQYHRHDVLPGITGLWQVKGRSGSKSKKLHVYDFFYVNRWSLRLDLMILFQTILVVVAGKGA
jgi:lipopolysaccharide/colanic/teichoic acid biosynthesis glycosyltransferase